jgi:hypothetical protein
LFGKRNRPTDGAREAIAFLQWLHREFDRQYAERARRRPPPDEFEGGVLLGRREGVRVALAALGHAPEHAASYPALRLVSDAELPPESG